MSYVRNKWHICIGSGTYISAHLCGDDTVTNGICLCSNHDKAYEKGNILVKPNTEIVIHESANTKVSYNKIRLPINKGDYPSSERLNQRLELSLKKQNNNDFS